MSDLQIGLIALGVLLILLVLGFNWWQDRRARNRMQAHFPASDQDPLLGAQDGRGPGTDSQRREPGMNIAAAAAPSVEPGSDADDTEEPDAGCEIVIEVNFGAPVRGADLLPQLQGLRQVGRKPLRVFATTEAGRHRACVHAAESYASLQLAVLLANRSGPLTAIEWSQAWARAQDLAERFDATIEGPDQQLVLERAAKLDDMCAALDTQVGLTLLLGTPRSAAEVVGAARELGFAPHGARLAWLADGGVPRFTLSRADGVSFDDAMSPVEQLLLLLDVPCSPADPRAFGRMVDVGRDLAAKLQADLVDDQGKPLVDGADAVIDERLQVLFGQLDQAGLPAGSARAQMVFA